MGLFAGARRRKMVERLISLGEMCSTMATTQLVVVLPKEGNLSVREASEHIHFWATIAAVGLGMTGLSLTLGGQRLREVRKVHKALKKQLDKWNSRGRKAYSDFLRAVASEVDGGMSIEQAYGTWLIRYIKRSEPSEEELEIGRTVCAMLFVQMAVEMGLEEKAALGLLEMTRREG